MSMWNGRLVTIKINGRNSMQKILLYGLVIASVLAFGISGAMAKNIAPDCSYNGIKLSGKVKIVKNFADIKVQKVEHFEDLDVQFVKNFPNACGQWQIVDNFPDFTIQLVDNFPDITIKEVKNFPGIR